MSNSAARRMRRAKPLTAEVPMNRSSGLQLPRGMMPQVQQPEAALQVAQPLNDTQLVALIAAQVYGAGVLKSPKEAVETAFELVAHCIVGFKTNLMGEKLKKIAESMTPPESDAPTG